MKNNNLSGKSITLPQDLSFSTDYSCSCDKCQWMNGGRSGQVYCDYYHQYYDPSAGYDCKHFKAK